MAELNQNKLSSYKGFYTPLKGIVMRENTEDPTGQDRIQVCIPSYHGAPDTSKCGSGNDPGEYPWAQLCVTDFKEAGRNLFAPSTSTTGTKSVAGSIATAAKNLADSLIGKRKVGGKDETNIPVIYPKKDDTIWLLFEGGDIRSPVYFGSLSSTVKPISMSGGVAAGSGGNLAALALEVIMSEETSGGYAVINWGWDIDAVSIGPLQWHSGRYQEVMQVMYNKDANAFNAACASVGAPDYASACAAGNAPTWFDRGSAYGRALMAVMGGDSPSDTPTEYAKAAFDEVGQRDVGQYIAHARESFGITDGPALVFFASCYNQSPAGADDMGSSAGAGADLDKVYNTSLGCAGLNSDANYGKPRRKREYDMIKQMVAEGRFNFTSGGGSCLWPVPASNTVSSPFGTRIIPEKGYVPEHHNGIDIPAPEGTEIIACMDGTITETGYSGYGNYTVLSGASYNALHGHQSSILVSVGQTVTAGQVIGLVGNTGASFGSHLHITMCAAGQDIWGSGHGNIGTSLDPLTILVNPEGLNRAYDPSAEGL